MGAVTNGTTTKDPTKKVSLNYVHLKLGQDEDDAVIEDGSLQVAATDIDRVENEYEVTDSEEATASVVETVAPSSLSEPVNLIDENDNKTLSQEPNSRKVKTGLLVEIESEVNRLSEPGQGESNISYVNLDRPPMVHSPNLAKTVAYSPSSPSSYYTNLDTKGELPHRSTIPDQRGPMGGARFNNGKSDSEFNFDAGVNPQGEKFFANVVDVEGKEHVGHDQGISNMIIQSPPKGKLNYIQVAFEDGTVSSAPQRSTCSSSGSTPPNTPNSPLAETESPAKGSDVYAVIDTNKTVALANSQRQINDGDVSSRRTRHDGPVQPR